METCKNIYLFMNLHKYWVHIKEHIYVYVYV
jgi:hypothetical protein